MSKRVLAWMLTLTLFFSTCPTAFVRAETNTEGYYTYTVTNGEATIVSVSDTISGDQTLPTALGGYPVTAIGERAFYAHDQLQSIVLPATLETIGKGAFEKCTALTTVTMAEGLVTIGTEAFWRCTRLSEIRIPDTVKDVQQNAFGSCVCLKTAQIGSGVETLGMGAFAGCTMLSSVSLSEGLRTIEDCVFSDCPALRTITVPNSVTAMGREVFSRSGVEQNQSLRDSDGMLFLGGFLVDANEDFMGRYVVPTGTRGICGKAFLNCNKLVSVALPKGITRVADFTFASCSSLRSVVISEGVTYIDDRAFFKCQALEELVLPKTLVNVNITAFSGIADYGLSIEHVYFGGDEAAWTNIKNRSEIPAAQWHYNACVHEYDNGCDEQCNRCGAMCGTAHQYDSETDYLCNRCGVLRHFTYEVQAGEAIITAVSTAIVSDVVVPTTVDGYPVTAIGAGAFHGCSAITRLVLPEGVHTIGANAFEGCTDLKRVALPQTMVTVEKGAFRGACALQTVHYRGNKAAGDSIAIATDNVPLTDATWYYDACTGEHTYTSVCDTICNRCCWERTAPSPHSYSHSCDTVCNACAFEREIKHTWDNVCDTTCDVCGEQRNAEHVWDTVCDTQCDRCGTVREVAHVWQNPCDTACDVCGKQRTTEHTAVVDAAVPPTCLDNGLTTGTHCGECGIVLIAQKPVSATGHTVVTSQAVAPTCTEAGKDVGSHCSQCGAVLVVQETIAALGHTVVTDAALAPTCTASGLTAGEHCTVCHAVLSAQEAVAALGHVYDSAADETCNVCGGIRYYTYEVTNGTATITTVSTKIAGEVILPATLDGYPVTAVAAEAFRGCEGIRSLTIPAAIETLGEGAFYGCSQLQTVYWNAVDCTVTGGTARPLFEACDKLNYVHIASGVQRVPAYAFVGAPLTAVSLAAGVTHIGDYAFSGCAALRSLTLPQGVLSVGEGAFRGCGAIENVMLPDSLHTIGNYAFMSCKGMRELTVGSDLQTVGYAAFLDCEALGSVRYNGTLTMRATVQCGSDNTPLLAATWHYLASYGDVDGSGTVDSTDARLVLQYTVKKIAADALDTVTADVDSNGTVDSTDARLILQYAVKKIDKFA